jgi:CubicO group peptidase (beta-lactamase class C family)
MLVLASMGAAAPAAQSRLPAEWNKLAGMFDDTLREDRIVGGSVALVEDGRIVARHHYGFADKTNGRRVDGNTIFHWASITKTLNAIAMMQLRDHGMICLEESIAWHVPELRRMHNPYGSMDDITLTMLLEHSAGFQAGTWPYKQGKDWEPFEPRYWEQLVAMMPYQQIAFAPGSRFSYSNPSWIYLARILEEKTGDPWEAYIEKNIFAPLGMSRSYFAITPYYLRPHRSHRYSVEYDEAGQPQVIDQGREFDPGITVPNGGWNAPIDDVAAYIGFLTGASGAFNTANGLKGDDNRRSFDAVYQQVMELLR